MPKGNTLKLQITGAKEVGEVLDELGKSISKSVVRAAFKKGASPLVQEISRRAPRGPGKGKVRLFESIRAASTLNRNQRRRRRRSVGKGAIEYFVGSTDPKAHLVEFGHALVKTTSGGGSRVIGHVPPHPFMRPAWDEMRVQVLVDVQREIAAGVRRTVKRLTRQAQQGKLSRGSVKSLLGARSRRAG